MKLEPIGEMTDEELEQRAETVEVPIVTYHHTTHKRKETIIAFRSEAPIGADIGVMKGLAGAGLSAEAVLAYLERSMTDKGRKNWDELLADDDYMVKPDTLIKAYNALVAVHVSPFPTTRLAGSPRTEASTNRTTTAARKRTPARREALKKF